MSNKEQTSVEQFWDKIALKLSSEQVEEFLPFLKKAKRIGKKQLKNAYDAGVWDVGCRNSDSEKYYNETYGGEK